MCVIGMLKNSHTEWKKCAGGAVGGGSGRSRLGEVALSKSGSGVLFFVTGKGEVSSMRSVLEVRFLALL